MPRRPRTTPGRVGSCASDTAPTPFAVAPEVSRSGQFAMKGGTALNLFVHEMPRLSVDIDIAYTSWATPRENALRAISNEIAANVSPHAVRRVAAQPGPSRRGFAAALHSARPRTKQRAEI